MERLPAKISRMGDRLCRLAEHAHVMRTRQRGLIGALELTPEKSSGMPYPTLERRAWRICRETLANGVWLRPLGDVLYVMPPLAISLDELDEIFAKLAAAIDRVTAER
jgi:adenosylmethionine-8-amino-7-oxononanoate aminotransferase